MRKVIHIYKTYKPFTHGGVETYIDSILNYQGSKFEHTLLSIGNINHTNNKTTITMTTTTIAITLRTTTITKKNNNK